MKHLLNKLSVWQRIFAILAFGFLIFMIGVWYRAGKEYIIFLVWFVYVAAAYGLCLGVSKIMPLNKLSGWHRIFLVYACTHLVIVVFICTFMPEIVSGSRRRSLGFEDAIGFIFTCGIMPIGLIYGLGRSVGWALRGFGTDSYKSEKYKKQKLSERVEQRDGSYVRSWAEERRNSEPKNLTPRQILFGAMMYGLSRFGKKDPGRSTPPELKSLGVGFDASKHYSGDGALFELGCYMYFPSRSLAIPQQTPQKKGNFY